MVEKMWKILGLMFALILCSCSSGTSFNKMNGDDTIIRYSTCMYLKSPKTGEVELHGCSVDKRDIQHYIDLYESIGETEYRDQAVALLEKDKEMVENITSKLVNLKECDGIANRNSLLYRLENDDYWVFFYKDYIFVQQGDLKQAYVYPEDVKEIAYNYYTETIGIPLEKVSDKD